MTPAARSVFLFGIYLYLVGITLLFVPNLFLQTLQLPETKEVWLRIVGILVVCLGFYYHRSGAQQNIGFIQLTIPVRTFVFISFLALVLLNYAAPVLAGIGAVDLLGAGWTYLALRKKAE